MATKRPLGGINGVLGELISTPATSSSPAHTPAAQEQSSISPALAATHTRSSARPLKAKARLGRPPGQREPKQTPKKKTTLRLCAQLMADYRDWSWDARCQLGELVERALVDYRDRRRGDS